MHVPWAQGVQLACRCRPLTDAKMEGPSRHPIDGRVQLPALCCNEQLY